MKKILVTGGCGFLGSYICELFNAEGWEVVAYDNLTKFEYCRTGYDTDAIRDYNSGFLGSIGVPILKEDIRNPRRISKAIHGCDLVAHCAAQPAMTIAIEYPRLDFAVNLAGTLNVLDACRKWDVPVVNCSTIHVYGNEIINKRLIEGKTRFSHPPGLVDESFPLLSGVLSPLHASKRAIEIYVQTYIDTYGLAGANFRLTGIYGPRQFGGEDHGWVANFVIKTILGEPIKIFGTDKQVRDVLYVEDAAKAFWAWYKSGCVPGTYNIGGGEQTILSILELLNLLENLTGERSPVTMLSKRYGDLWWFASNYSKALKTFNWSPSYLPSDGIERLVEWVKENKELFVK